MVPVPRRVLGVLLLVLATLLLAQPFLLRSAGAVETGFSGLVTVGRIAFVAAGAIALVAGGAATGGRRLTPRWSLAAPAVSAVVALAVGVAASPDGAAGSETISISEVVPVSEPFSTPGIALAGSTPLVAAGAVVGASLAPVTLGATRDDTVTLLAGVVVFFTALFAAPDPALALVGGVGGGGVAVGVLWALDAETWRP